MTITETELVHLPLDQLNDHPDNLRGDVGDLTEMVASIHALGIIEPLVVTPDGALFTVLAGHRRLAAAREAGLQLVPCVVRTDVGEQEAAEIMLVENLIRTNLNPIEEGTGFARLAALGLSQREIAERVGCNQSHVSKRIKLTTIPAKAQTLVATGELHIDDALQLAALVELDADSADEWVADVLKRGVKQAWPHLAERIRRASGEQRRVAAEAEGKASGLKAMRNRDRLVDFDECDRESATHWIVNVHGELVWLARRSEASDAAPINPTKERASDRPKPKPIPEVDHSPEGEAAIEAANDALVAMCEATENDDELLARLDTLAWGEGIAPDVDVVLEDEREFRLHTANDLLRYLRFGELPEVFIEPEPIAQMAGLLGVEPAEVEEMLVEAGVPLPDEWDQQRTTPPWKAYAFTNETKTIGGIREHKNPAKLRHAAVYEAATKNRPLVLAAIDERLAELGE